MAERRESTPWHVTDNTPAITWRGESITSDKIVRMFVNAAEKRFANRTSRILATQALRRGTLEVKLSSEFRKKYREIAEWVVAKLEVRETAERDLIAKAGAVEPHFSRKPLKTTETAREEAEAFEAYVNEIFQSSIPFQEMLEKGTEDGEYGWTALPAEVTEDGQPDFWDRIEDYVYESLDPDEKSTYQKDDGDRKGRYVRVDDEGNKVPNPKYSRNARGQRSDDPKDRDEDKSDEAYQEALRNYLLGCEATVTRVIPALDCVPIQVRGRGRRKWDTVGLIERSLFEPEELIRNNYAFPFMGKKLVVPRGFRKEWTGKDGQFYLYSMYLTVRDDRRRLRPFVAYTVGGAHTRWGDSGSDDKASVAVIDLYKEYGLEGQFWGYEYALHTADDDPDWYGRPYLWAFIRRILAVEGLLTANAAATAVSAYTGHFFEPNDKLVETLERMDPEAVVDSATHQLQRPNMPGPGEIEPAYGSLTPAQKSEIGDDAWRMLDIHQMALDKALVVDQLPLKGPSGAAMMVSESLGQIAKRHIREAAVRSSEGALMCDAKIRTAMYLRFKVKWPIHTAEEKPIGLEKVEQQTYSEFEPDWVGNPEKVCEGNYLLKGSFPKEFNLAKADLEINGYLKGVRALKHVAEAFGESDPMALRTELAKDELWKEPDSKAFLRQLVARWRGMRIANQVTALQVDNKMTPQGVPGAPGGVPTAILERMNGAGAAQPPQPTGTGPGIAGSQRGGMTAGAMVGSEMAANAEGMLGVS